MLNQEVIAIWEIRWGIMEGIVDRIEGNIVVVEINDKMQNIDITKADGNITEGDVVDIVFKDGAIISIKRNDKKTIARKEYINSITKDMWQ